MAKKEKLYLVFFDDINNKYLPALPVKVCTYDGIWTFLSDFFENEIEIITPFPVNEDNIAENGLTNGNIVISFVEVG